MSGRVVCEKGTFVAGPISAGQDSDYNDGIGSASISIRVSTPT